MRAAGSMSALCWTRGATGFRRTLRFSGRTHPAALEGTVTALEGPRRSASASPRELGLRKDWGLAELLEVLEARVRQLQAESPAEVTVNRVEVAQVPAAQVMWNDKLNREKQKQQKRQPQIEKWVKKQTQKRTYKPKHLDLLLEPQFRSQQLMSCLGAKTLQSPWEENLEKVLQQAPQKLRAKAKAAPARKVEEEEDEKQVSSREQNMLSFLQGCLSANQLPLAHHILVTQHSAVPRRKCPPLTLAMYNMVMLGWARKGSFKELVYVFFMVKDAGLTPDLLSYAAALQCMGRVNQDPNTIKRCVKQMAQDGLQLEQLFTDLPMSSEERAAVLRAVLKAQPDFRVPPPPAQVNSSVLLKDIYGSEGLKLYPKLPLPLETLQDLFEDQLHQEMQATITVESVENPPKLNEQVIKARNTLNALRAQWKAALLQVLQEAKTHMAQEVQQGQPSLYPFLFLLSEEDLVDLLLQRLQAMPSHGESLMFMAHDLSICLFNRHAVQQRQLPSELQDLKRRYMQYVRLLASDTQVATPRLPRQHWEALGKNEELPLHSWPVPLVLRLGKHLVEMLVQAVKMPHNLASGQGSRKLIPVLYHVYSFRSFRQIGIVKPHPAYTHLLATAAETTLTFDSTDMPMLCPPLPWTTSNTGAFLLSHTKLMRGVDSNVEHQRLLDHCPTAELHGALDTLTQLGNCAWRVNGRLLDLVLEVFREKGSIRLGVPPPLSEAPPRPKTALPPHMSLIQKADIRRELQQCLKVTREMHSLRMEALYRLSLAQHLRGRIFWLPHNMDFRGRTYPCPPHFNHLGSDLARALLQFAEGRPLGPQGLDWLKIHLINLTGLKKRDSLKARLAFANKMMDDILDSADRPMTGRKWWMEADEPWQTLACCMEVAQAVRSPDPAAFVSHQPVHQDGSCNGLQHYAALGRDSIGAASVNLLPSDLPQDVYSEVATKVEVFRQQDVRKGEPMAQLLEGHISRKVVKQTVMTVVYGVTRYGGRLQIEKRLRELGSFPQVPRALPARWGVRWRSLRVLPHSCLSRQERVWEASHYLVRLVFKSLQEMFSSTRVIQQWLSESARLIAQAGHPVEWVTPLGVPVIQPYFQDTKYQVLGGIQSITCTSTVDSSKKPNTLKQRNGFPPNFIHSLDSTHMMLTALHCYRKGLTFVSVHDCFWTHAADISIMNQVCREQFIKLHSQPILQDLAAFLIKRYCDLDPRTHKASDLAVLSQLKDWLESVPETGDLDLEQVKHSKYFFS